MSGGAGVFAKSIHIAMQELGMSSVLVTRERNDVEDTVIIKPLTRVEKSLRARRLKILGKLGLIDNKYATFGIEKSPVEFSDIQHALASRQPQAFIFYWVSYFVSFKCMFELRRAYPDIPFVFICLDEGFLAGGCHYSWGCHGYEGTCNNCPATFSPFRKRRIEQELHQRVAMISAINPIVLYPTTNLQQMGKKSAVLKSLRSAVVPLGAVSSREQNSVLVSANRKASGIRVKKEKLILLVRSSGEYRKGCDLFVAAIKKLSAKIPDLRLRLEVISIGDATLKNAQIDNYVDHTYLGLVPRKELLSIYEKADALIVTSREDAGPLMINECVALGKFVISTSVGVANDLIIDNQNGLIIQDLTSDAISDSLVMFLETCQGSRAEIMRQPIPGINSSQLTFEGYVGAMMDIIKVAS